MKILKAAFLAGALALAGGNSGNWMAEVERVEHGHRIGNPEASTTLAEFVSYTCPHCATFAIQGDPALKLAYVMPGKISLEIRHLVRDPVDLTAAMIAQCGEVSKFPQNHAALMATQEKWLGKARQATPAQVQRWTSQDRAAARRAIASDLDFYELMEGRGYRITDLDRCLNDDAKAVELVETSQRDAQKFGVRGTPSFVLNGQLLDSVHSWSTLEPALNAHFAEASGES